MYLPTLDQYRRYRRSSVRPAGAPTLRIGPIAGRVTSRLQERHTPGRQYRYIQIQWKRALVRPLGPRHRQIGLEVGSIGRRTRQRR